MVRTLHQKWNSSNLPFIPLKILQSQHWSQYAKVQSLDMFLALFNKVPNSRSTDRPKRNTGNF